MAKRSATTSSSRTSRPGTTPATRRRPRCARSRSCSRTCTSHSGRTNRRRANTMHVTLNVWRQAGPDAPGAMQRYETDDVTPDMSFLEMLDVVNESLISRGEQPIAFDHDCREGICGSCGMMIDGVAHGPTKGTATCQLHMRSFPDGATI